MQWSSLVYERRSKGANEIRNNPTDQLSLGGASRETAMGNNEQQFCFYSPDFQRNIKAAWKDLHSDKDFCDVTIACDGKQIQTHKFIIASSSPVLRKILKQNLNQHPIVYLMGVKYQVMENMLNFMYEGEVNIAEEDVDSFFEAAENLKVRGLSEGNRNNLNYFNSKSDKTLFSSKRILPPTPQRKRPLEIESSVNKNGSKVSKKSSSDRLAERGNGTHYEAGDISDDVQFVDSGNGIKTENCYEVAEQETYDDYSEEPHFGVDEIHMDQYQQVVHQPYYYVKQKKEKSYTCEKCDKQFTFKRALTRHIESIHEGKVVECDECGKKFNQIDNLRRHKQSIHEGVRYNCEFCEYKATKKEYLRTHNEKHHYVQYQNYQNFPM